jgi:uncharacterized protein YkwD
MKPASLARLARVAVGGVVVALLMAAGAALSPRTALALTNCDVAVLTFDSEEQEFLQLINQYRAQNGLAALTASTNLNRSASWMARDLAVNRYFSHTDSIGRAPSTRVANCDGQPYVGENIAAGTIKDTAAEAFDMWRASAGHNANMLGASYRQIGIARYYDANAPYRWYWVTDFSTSNDGTNASSATSGGGGGSGGGSTATATPSPTATPPPPAGSPIAAMISPVDGATLGSTTRFTWAAGSEASAYYFYMGTYSGAANWLSVSMGKSTSLTVRGLPATGQTIYVRLWSLTATGWKYQDYTYRLP